MDTLGTLFLFKAADINNNHTRCCTKGKQRERELKEESRHSRMDRPLNIMSELSAALSLALLVACLTAEFL